MIKNCKLGKNVIFEDMNSIIIKNSTIGNNVFIGANTKIINTKIGNNCKIYSFVNLYGPNLIISNHCKIGTFVEITNNVYIGPNSVISSHSFICSGVTLEGNNFIGHGVLFTNDKNPIPYNTKFKLEKTLVKSGAVIGTGCKLLPIIIGKKSTIGMGSIVTKNVPDKAVVYGKAARATIIKFKNV